MRTIEALALATVLASAAGHFAAAQDVKTFNGVISDSQCALNVHSLTRSHQEMLKSKSMGGTPADCALFCVDQHGGVFVLAHKDEVYKLDDQRLARAFAAKNVKITGTLDPDKDKNTIHIIKIEEER
ncbi:MAG: hypothetical protein WBC78_20000 [Candidatus Sulfotelmatobacter sp.]